MPKRVDMMCVKTGAVIQVGQQRWFKGDLFKFGEGYVMKHCAFCVEKLVDYITHIHAHFTSYSQWWLGSRFGGQAQQGVLFLDEPEWFDYDGRPIAEVFAQ